MAHDRFAREYHWLDGNVDTARQIMLDMLEGSMARDQAIASATGVTIYNDLDAAYVFVGSGGLVFVNMTVLPTIVSMYAHEAQVAIVVQAIEATVECNRHLETILGFMDRI